MLILISILLLALVALFVQFGTNYYTQVRVMRRFFKTKNTAPEEARAKTDVQENISYLSVFSGGVLDLYTAREATEPQPLLVWVHGGGYVGGDKRDPEAWARVIAAELHMAVASINYCLAPEQHYPCPVLQLGEALRFLLKNAEAYNLDASRIFLAGDSAGAQITSQYAALVHSAAMQSAMNLKPVITPEQLKGLVLCCGFYNMDTVLKSHFPAIRTFLWVYTNEKKPARFLRADELSAVKNVKDGYPDVFITCGDADPFLGQAHEMIQALQGAGVAVEEYLPKVKGKKLGHEYQFLVGTQEADEALQRAVQFIEKRL